MSNANPNSTTLDNCSPTDPGPSSSTFPDVSDSRPSSKKRKASPPEVDTNLPKRFQFIDNTDVSSSSHNSTQVRRHVMQEFMRQKRWQVDKSGESSHGNRASTTPSSSAGKRGVQKIRARRANTQQSAPTSSPPSLSTRRSSTSAPPNAQGPRTLTVSPLTALRERDFIEVDSPEDTVYIPERDLRPGEHKISEGSPDFFFLGPAPFPRDTGVLPAELEPLSAIDPLSASSNSSGGTLLSSIHDFPSSIASVSVTEIVPNEELVEICDDFIKFLHCAEHLALAERRMPSNCYYMRIQPQRCHVFRPGGPLERLLVSPCRVRYVGQDPAQQSKARAMVLFTLNVVIWQYRHTTDLSEEFLRELGENIRYYRIDEHLSVRALMQILLNGSRNRALQDPERPLLVRRMMTIIMRLKATSFERLTETLFHLLTLDPGLRPVISDWEHELRAEIMHVPITNAVTGT